MTGMRVGFTGTREGLTTPQKAALRTRLTALNPSEFHHGCCVGADADAAEMLLGHRCDVHAHPSNLPPRYTDIIALQTAEVEYGPKPPLERNRVIVDSCDVLFACPKGPEEVRSGTWSTVRYARKIGRSVVIIWPNGAVEEG